LVEIAELAVRHPAEHGIDFSVFMAAPPSHERRILRPLPFSGTAGKAQQIIKEPGDSNCYFEAMRIWITASTMLGFGASISDPARF
jgi:hypothetical protein